MANPSFHQLDLADVQKMLAARSLLQLYWNSFFIKAAFTEYKKGTFEHGDTCSIKRPKISGEAEEFDPRGGGSASESEPGYVTTNIILDKLFTQAFPIFSSDSDPKKYIKDYSDSNAAAIRKSVDTHFYNTGFRTYSIPSVGSVQYTANPPIAIVASEDASSNLAHFNGEALLNAGGVLESNDVPAGDWYAALSTTAKTAYLGDSIDDRAAVMAGSSSLLQNGLPVGQFLSRYGFMCGGTNAIGKQQAVVNIADGAASRPVASAAADIAIFFDANHSQPTILGAVEVTLNATAALQPGVAVGKIAKLSVTESGATVAYGVILRVDAANKKVWMVPYSTTGEKLVASEITSAHSLSIPLIPSINVGYHKQHVIWASRQLAAPAPGEGAIMESATDADSGLALQITRGSYDVNRFKSTQRVSVLCGVKATDPRMGVLMLSK